MDTEKKPHTSGCLVCGNEAVYSRGLCQAHYRQLNARIASYKSKKAAELFERNAVKLGWALPKTGGGRPKSWSPFDDIADMIAEQVSAHENETAADLAEELHKRANPKTSNQVAKPKKKSQ